MSAILGGLASVLSLLFSLYRYVIIIAVILSWVRADFTNPVVGFFYKLTDPIFGWIRRRMPFVVVSGLDLSPLVVYAIIIFLDQALVGNLLRWVH